MRTIINSEFVIEKYKTIIMVEFDDGEIKDIYTWYRDEPALYIDAERLIGLTENKVDEIIRRTLRSIWP